MWPWPQWLASIAGDRAGIVAEAVAEHYASALDSLPALAARDLPERATLAASGAEWFERAAEAALALSAPEAAARMFGRSIALTDGAATRDRARRRLRLGQVLAASADLEAGIGEIGAALELYEGDQDGLATAAHELGRAYMQQIRFVEAEELAAATLERVTELPEPARARLHGLHAWAVSAQGRSDGVEAEANAAWDAAQLSGDPALEVDVLLHRASALDEVGVGSDEHWTLLHERALASGRWEQAVIAGRIRAVRAADVDPRAALVDLAATSELAAAHGQTEQLGWGHYSRCEALWVIGDWDAAIEAGLAAVALAERYAYQRLGFRTWVVLLPMAAARRDPGLVEHFQRWWKETERHFPSTPSPYGRMLEGAIGVWVAQATGQPEPMPAEDLTDAAVPMSNPHFLAAIETVVDAWVRAGRRDLAASVASQSSANSDDPDGTVLMRVSPDLIRGLLGEAERAALAAKEAAAFGAPWWELRARRILGEPTADLEARLGLS